MPRDRIQYWTRRNRRICVDCEEPCSGAYCSGCRSLNNRYQRASRRSRGIGAADCYVCLGSDHGSLDCPLTPEGRGGV